MKKIWSRWKRALAIEYAIVMMVLVAAFSAAVLTTATLTSQSADSYRDYTEKKRYLDSVGAAYIANRCDGASYDLDAIEGGEPFGYYLEQYSDTLYVRSGASVDSIDLFISLQDTDGDGKLEVVRYIYGML